MFKCSHYLCTALGLPLRKQCSTYYIADIANFNIDSNLLIRFFGEPKSECLYAQAVQPFNTFCTLICYFYTSVHAILALAQQSITNNLLHKQYLFVLFRCSTVLQNVGCLKKVTRPQNVRQLTSDLPTQGRKDIHILNFLWFICLSQSIICISQFSIHVEIRVLRAMGAQCPNWIFRLKFSEDVLR